MKLNHKLNLVMPIESGWVHATPISYAVFEKYYLVISKAFAAIYREGLSNLAGPRVAKLLLKEAAMAEGIWDTPDGVENGLMQEIVRLSNVIVPTQDKKGWETLPLHSAYQQERIVDEERAELENALVFFTLVSSMHKKQEIGVVLSGMTKFWGGLTTSSDCTAYRDSLKTSTAEDDTSKKATASSIPS